MKKGKLFSAFLIFTLCIIFLFSFTPKVNAVTNNLRWYNRPITFYATNQLSTIEINALTNAMAEWNNIGKGTFFVYGGQLGTNIVGYDTINVVGRRPISDSNRLAATNVIYANGTDKIIEADIVLNSNLDFSNKILKSIFMHELGHALGLADNTDMLTSIMFASYTGRTIITDYDINDINTLY